MFSTWGLEPSWCNTTLWAVAGRVLRNFFADPLIYLPFPHPLPGFPSFWAVFWLHHFFRKTRFLSFCPPSNPWPSTLGGQSADGRGLSHLCGLALRPLLGVGIAGAQWLETTDGCARGFAAPLWAWSESGPRGDSKESTCKFRVGCFAGNPCDVRKHHTCTTLYDCGLGTYFFTAGYSHNKRKFRCGRLLGRKHMFQVAFNLLQLLC